MNHLPSPIKYREDINGLRSWAVIAVLLFHFSAIGLPGGFIGVDIFLVISGYLMTSIVIKGLENNNFSLLTFYLSRIRRIVPALMVVIAVLLALGWFWLPSIEYKSLADEASKALFFISNLHYYNSSGYFDGDAHDKWLLHTWSLSVEAQFYVLYPIFLIIIWRFSNKISWVFLSLISALLTSLTLNIYAVNIKPSAAFYLLPTRSWELVFGGVIFLIIKTFPLKKNLLSVIYWAGWSLLILSFIFIHEQLLWPGYWTIIPVLGTGMIILGQKNSPLTKTPLAQWLGERSYSLYLWHWPIVVTLYLNDLQDEWFWALSGLSLSVILAHLSYQFIEIPTRRHLSNKTFAKEITSIGFATVLIGISSLVIREYNFNLRDANQTKQAIYLSKFHKDSVYVKKIRSQYMEQCNFKYVLYESELGKLGKNCISPNPNSVFLWGDSHAQALGYGIREYLNKHYPDIEFSQLAASGCRPHLLDDSTISGNTKQACDRSNRLALKSIATIKPKIVVLAQRQNHEHNDYQSIAMRLRSLGVENVFIIGPVPQWKPSLPRVIALRHWDPDKTEFFDKNFVSKLVTTDRKMQQSLTKIDSNIHYISLLDALCSNKKCLAKVDLKNTPLVWDYGHLTNNGASYVFTNVLSSQFNKILNKEPEILLAGETN